MRTIPGDVSSTISTCFFAIFLSLAWIGTAQAIGVDVEGNAITISLQVEPPNLDSSMSEDTTSGFILAMVNEGLVSTGKKGKIRPGVAERWQVDDLEATFWLRDDAIWSNGDPIVAQDFVYSWRRLVNPKTGAAGSTFFAYVIENASDILAGKKPVNSLGVVALDEHTLKVRLSQPTPFLLTILSGTGYFPIQQKFFEAQNGRFGAAAENMLANGPFKLDSWVHNSTIVLNRNDRYWNNEATKLDAIKVGYITSDVRSMLNVYKSHQLATLNLNEEILDDAAESGYRIKKAPTNCLAWMLINLSPERPTANLKLREAIRMAFDRDSYVNTIVGLPGTRKIDSVFTRRIKGVKGSFQREFPETPIEFNVVKAKKLLAQAKQEMAVDEIPPLVLLANETRQIEAEFIQAQLGSALGLDIRVDKQTFKQAIAKMNKGEYDLARAAFCGGALFDPVFFAGIFESGSSFNNGRYNNAEYDRLIKLTNSTADQEIRMKAFGQIQQLLYRDVPIIPTHEISTVYLEDRRVKDLQRFPSVNFSRGFIAP